MNFIGNWFDIVFIAIILIMAILAFLRGFIRDFASFLNWVIAISITYLLTPFIVGLFAKSSYADVINKLSVGCVLFVILLILTSLTTSRIARDLSQRLPSSVDQSLGFAFGFAKAYLICALIFEVIISWHKLVDSKKTNNLVGPEWLTKAQSYKILELGGDALKPAAKAILKTFNGSQLEEKVKEKVKDQVKEQVKKKVKEQIKAQAKSQDDEDDDGKGYDAKERQKMNHLIDIIDKEK
jgi:membrane protein required for colicin V production